MNLRISNVENGYFVKDESENKFHVFEKGSELELIKLVCILFQWKDVIDFNEEGGETTGISEEGALEFFGKHSN